MITFPHGNHPSLLDYAAHVSLSDGFMHDAVAIGAKRNGELFAAAVFQCRTTRAVEVHFGSTDAQHITRDVIRTFLRYGFNFLGHDMIEAKIACWNVRMLTIALKMGFYPSGYLRSGAADGSDVMILAMKKHSLRWPPRRDNAHTTVEINQLAETPIETA